MAKSTLLKEFKGWKNNRLDQPTTVKVADVAAQYIKSRFYQDELQGGMRQRCFWNFLSSPEADGGLAISNETSEAADIYEAVARAINHEEAFLPREVEADTPTKAYGLWKHWFWMANGSTPTMSEAGFTSMCQHHKTVEVGRVVIKLVYNHR